MNYWLQLLLMGLGLLWVSSLVVISKLTKRKLLKTTAELQPIKKENEVMEKLTLLHDRGIGEGNLKRADALGFDDYAQVLAEAVVHTQGPFTIGIFGEWGTGKTSLMGMIKKKLSDQDTIIPVWVNAWRFEKEEHPLVPLIATILNELKKYPRFSKPQKDSQSQGFLNTLSKIGRCFAGKVEIGVPGLGKICGEVDLSKLPADKNQPPPLLEEFIYCNAFEELSEVKLDDQTKIVVLIDDLDRSFPDMAIKLLESIKLVLWQPGFIFIVGVSRNVIEAYLKKRYEDFGLTDFDGAQYLDKIIQLPFSLPPTRNPERIKFFTHNLLAEIHEDYKKVLKDIVGIIGPMCSYNPRSVIRFLNNLIINKNIGDLSLKGTNIPIGIYAVLEILRQRFSKVFTILSNSKDICKILAGCVENFDNKYKEIPPEQKVGDLQEVANEVNSKPDLKTLLFGTEIGKQCLEEETLRTNALELYASLVMTSKDVPLEIITWRASNRDEEFKRKMYRVDAFINAPDKIMDLIESVTYHLSPTYPSPVQVKEDRASKFKLKELAWGSSILKAEIKIKDQTEPIRVEGYIQLVDQPKPESYRDEVLANAQL